MIIMYQNDAGLSKFTQKIIFRTLAICERSLTEGLVRPVQG